MSWEEMSRESYPCPCGKGTWVVIHRSDDWNRTEEIATILCEVCSKTHRIEEGHGTDKGMATTSYRIVARQPNAS